MTARVPFCYQGSKLKELPKIAKFFSGVRILEPFFGSGVITGNLGVPGCVANELNPDVCAIWTRSMANDTEFFSQITDLCDEANKNEQYYYERRDEYNELWRAGDWPVRRTALFFYLVNSSHAALIRYSSRGFSASFKHYLTHGRMYAVHDRIELLRRYAKNISSITCNDALHVLKTAHDVDVIYCDPPYIGGGTMYQKHSDWTAEHYAELLDVLRWQWTENRVPSVVSNYSHPDFDGLYDRTERFSSTRMASTKIVRKEDVLGFIGRLDSGLERFMK